MALKYSEPGELGSAAIEFNLPGTDGKNHRLRDFKDSKALVLVFMCNHCPYVIAVQDRINALAREYLPQGVQLVGINSNDASNYPADNFEAMKVRAQERKFVFPYLWDESQEIAKLYRAVCTPEFYVYAQSTQGHTQDFGLVLRYKGQLDDSWKDEKAVTRRDLALAIDQILLGLEPDQDQKPSMGCSIKWKGM